MFIFPGRYLLSAPYTRFLGSPSCSPSLNMFPHSLSLSLHLRLWLCLLLGQPRGGGGRGGGGGGIQEAVMRLRLPAWQVCVPGPWHLRLL